MIDLEPATRAVTALIASIRDEQLDNPTPCAGTSLGAMLDHVEGFATAFALAARKQVPPGGSQPPVVDAARLTPVWRTRIPARLAELAAAWQDAAAWSGMTEAGGVQLPGDVAGIFALDEVIVHGWDVAAASGQPVGYDDDLLAPLHEFLTASVAQNPNGTPGLFGPPVALPDDAPLLDRVLGLTGRDPRWSLEVVH
ncbi:MAG TPA: TIGR03086 family metal-binding protein [Jatrophihabitantaceae bacterium]|nr:TIGR03086 family metal-binding protein [Jatrophihabitantaceae bacterium]